jgi:L-iditol 2-dehydrogenase
MRVARLYGAGRIELSDEPVPVPGDGESLVRVGAVGICGSDLHWFADAAIGDAALTRPLVLGHEMAGVVVNGPLSGQRVAVDPAVPCFACRPCRAGNPNLCERIVFAGHGATDGGMREYLAWPSRCLHALPSGLDDVDGALLEPLGVALHALDLAHLRPASRVAVVGCGPIGLIVVQLALRAGATAVIAVEPLAHRRDAAAALGATALPPEDPAIRNMNADVAIEFAGTDGALAVAIEAVRPGTRVVVGGIPDTGRWTFEAAPARRKGLSLVMARRMKDVYDRAIALATSGAVDLHCLVSDRRPLDEAAGAFAQAAGRAGLKTVLVP